MTFIDICHDDMLCMMTFVMTCPNGQTVKAVFHWEYFTARACFFRAVKVLSMRRMVRILGLGMKNLNACTRKKLKYFNFCYCTRSSLLQGTNENTEICKHYAIFWNFRKKVYIQDGVSKEA